MYEQQSLLSEVLRPTSLSQLNLPSEPKIKYTLPKGSNKWKDMKENDPEKAKEYEKNYGQWTNLKSWSDQINRNL